MELEQQYFELFAGLERAHGVYEVAAPVAKGAKQAGRAYTVMEPLTVDLWQKHLAGEQGLGVVPIRDAGTVRFAAIDIDKNDIDHVALERRCEQLTMPVTICRSKSGGAHVYLFCREDIPAEIVRAKLAEWAAALGYPNAEIFPKQSNLASGRDVGNWINMPYFGGERTTRYAIRGGKAVDWKRFVEVARGRLVTAADLTALAPTPESSGDFTEGPPCLVTLAGMGMAEGMRNALLFNMGVYARIRYGGEGSQEDWRSHMLAYNDKYMSPPLPAREVSGLVKSIEKKDYFYTCQQAPIHGVCQRRACRLKKFGVGALVETPDIQLDKLIKNLTVPVTWIAVLGEHRLELTTEELLSQQHFRRACMEKISILPKVLKQETWDKVIRAKLDEAEVVEVPLDASPEGQLLHHLEMFCTGRAQARAKDELLQGKPWSEDGRTYFRAADCMRYLDQQHFRSLSQREMWIALGRYDVQSHTFKLKGKACSCWSLPEFDKQTEDFDVPRKAGETF